MSLPSLKYEENGRVSMSENQYNHYVEAVNNEVKYYKELNELRSENEKLLIENKRLKQQLGIVDVEEDCVR